MKDWISLCKRNSFESVAGNLGLTGKGNRWGPCPHCNNERSEKDKRPPIGIPRGMSGDVNWRCFICGVGGDIIDLVSYKMNNCSVADIPSGPKGFKDMSSIKEFFRVKEFVSVQVAQPDKKYIPENDMEQLWADIKKQPVASHHHRHINAFLESRGITPSNVSEAYCFSHTYNYNSLKKVSTSTGRMMPFWPYRWSQDYPLCIPLYDVKGKVRSFQGRAIAKRDDGRKTSCPLGFSMHGLFFACSQLLSYISGENNYSKFWVVEGEMDFIAIKNKMHVWDEEPVMGICAANNQIPSNSRCHHRHTQR